MMFRIIFLFCFAYQLQGLNAIQNSPIGWTKSSILMEDGSTIYYLISDFPMNYDEAYDFCKRETGYLAEPRSASQTEEINQLLSSDSSYWIGLTDRETEGLFIWNSDGANCESYHNWGGDNPNDYNNEDCTMIANFLDMQWNDEPCSRDAEVYGPIHAVCQKIA